MYEAEARGEGRAARHISTQGHAVAADSFCETGVCVGTIGSVLAVWRAHARQATRSAVCVLDLVESGFDPSTLVHEFLCFSLVIPKDKAHVYAAPAGARSIDEQPAPMPAPECESLSRGHGECEAKFRWSLPPLPLGPATRALLFLDDGLVLDDECVGRHGWDRALLLDSSGCRHVLLLDEGTGRHGRGHLLLLDKARKRRRGYARATEFTRYHPPPQVFSWVLSLGTSVVPSVVAL